MKTNLFQLGLAACLSGALLTACTPEIDAPEISAGSANFSKYVSLGNSLTSGFMDGALYREGQQASYPNMLAQQFKLAGGGEFKQPLITVGSRGDIGIGSTGNAKFILGMSADCNGVIGLGPLPADAAGGDATVFTPIGAQGPYNNMGVPGATATHLVIPGYGALNQFFGRFASSSTTSILQDAIAQQPTFFTLWIGNNDVLSYALDGGAVSKPTNIITPSAGIAGFGFDESIETVVHTMISGGAKGAVGNIPNVYNAPYFTTIPYNGLVLTRQGQADTLKGIWALQGISFDFSVGANPFIVKENGVIRKMESGERVLLSVKQDDLKCNGLGAASAIGDKFILSQAEIDSVQNAINAYNTKISDLATEHASQIALVDMHSYFNQIISGIQVSGVNYNSAFVSGGVFSLDGLHFNDKGAALVANQFIRSINSKFNSTIPTVNVNQYKGIRFP